jgi:hypothetical protein
MSDTSRETGILRRENPALIYTDRGANVAEPVSPTNPLPVTVSDGIEGATIVGDQSIVVGASAVQLTVPATATHAVVEGQLAAIRFRLTGQAPDATTGYDLIVGDSVQLSRAEALGFRAVRAGGTDGRVMVTYYQAGGQ